MKKPLVVLSSTCMLMFLSACSSPNLDYSSTSKPISAESARSSTKVERAIHSKINSHRKSIGRSSLQRHAALDKIARKHSYFMLKNAGKFGVSGKRISHMGFKGRAMKARMGFDMQSVSENVGAASASADPAGMLVKAWIKSRGHHFNIKGKYRYTGVGVAVDSEGYVYATQLFANPHVGRRWEYGRPVF